MVDLQLCGDAEAVIVFLKEAPAGIRQIFLYRGSEFFGSDERYRQHLRAIQRRTRGGSCGGCRGAGGADGACECSLDNPAWLRKLIAALDIFCSVRGQGLEALELTGLALGRQPQGILMPLARCLSDLTVLQRLHLAGCHLQDKGLSILLPNLASKMPLLSHISLAKNGLRDLELVQRLLKGRLSAQRRCQAVPLRILDLSANPLLGARPTGTRRSSGWVPDFELCYDCEVAQRRLRGAKMTREPLLKVLCDALRDGLQLRVVRLRSMRMTREDVKPLLQYLVQQVKQQQAGFEIQCPLETVSLEGNPIEPEFPAAIAHVLGQLADFAPPRWGGPPSESPAAAAAAAALMAMPPGPGLLGQSLSMPDSRRDHFGIAGQIERDAVSEGDAEGDIPDPSARSAIVRRLNEDYDLLLRPRLDERRAAAGAPAQPGREGARAASREGAAAPAQRQRIEDGRAPSRESAAAPRQRPRVEVFPHRAVHFPDGASLARFSNDSGITVGAIPDRGLECGFGPPVDHLVHLWSDSENGGEEPEAPRPRVRQQGRTQHRAAAAEAVFAQAQAPPPPQYQQPSRASSALPRREDRGQRHAKMELVRGIFHQGGNVPVDPEVLRYTLDLISSDTSLHTAQADEALTLLAERVAELRALHSRTSAAVAAAAAVARHHGGEDPYGTYEYDPRSVYGAPPDLPSYSDHHLARARSM